MTRRLTLGLLLAGLATGLALAESPAAKPKLTDAEARALFAQIRPQPGEDRFATIPWQTSLWEARQVAAREGKPILLWEMDGHPLGCG